MIHLPPIVGETWLNSKPLKREDFLGKVVLVDFWTYSCVNCLRTIPHVKKWWEAYRDQGFLIVGIHTPEFEFEKDAKNVEAAVKELGITWPVVLDNNFINWDNFTNRYWPAKYIADQKGRIVYTHFGEGAYGQTEMVIQNLIEGVEDISKLTSPETLERGSVCFIPTPELYCGYLRGYLSNTGGYAYDQAENYLAPERLLNNSIGLAGKFLATGEYVESLEEGATLLLKFQATEVNAVLSPIGNAIVEVLLDGQKILSELAGRDLGDDSRVVVEKPRMFNILRSKDLVQGTLVLRSSIGNFQAFAFTFSGCTT